MSEPLSEEKLSAIANALFAGRRIEAIKLYRECTGGELLEARKAVERLEADLRVTSPHKFSRAAGSGCTRTAATLVSGLLIGSAAFLWWIRTL